MRTIKERLAAGEIINTFAVGRFVDPVIVEMFDQGGCFDTYIDGEYSGSDDLRMWIINLKPGYTIEHIADSFDLRHVLDQDGEVLGTIGPGSRWFDSRANADRYRVELGESLAEVFVVAPVVLIPVNYGEAREGQDG